MKASYDDYVDHPRWGRKPRRTDLKVDAEDGRVNFHWRIGSRTSRPHHPTPNSMPYEFRSYHIADTAVKADATRQDPSATLKVSHYFDQDNQCLDCNRRFIFFAIEQKYWYETLRLPLDVDCVRCVPCRKKRREPRRENSRYQELLDQPERNDADLLELIDLYLSLVMRGKFTCKRLDRVRRFAKSLSKKARSGKRHARQMKLLGQLEKGSAGPIHRSQKRAL